MGKLTAEELRGVWQPGSFNRDAGSFEEFLAAVIEEAAGELSGRLGPSLYDATGEPARTRVKKAERELCDELLWREREKARNQNAQSGGSSSGTPLQTSPEMKNAETARERAEGLIATLLDSGYAGAVVTTGGTAATEAPGSWGIETCSA